MTHAGMTIGHYVVQYCGWNKKNVNCSKNVMSEQNNFMTNIQVSQRNDSSRALLLATLNASEKALYKYDVSIKA